MSLKEQWLIVKVSRNAKRKKEKNKNRLKNYKFHAADLREWVRQDSNDCAAKYVLKVYGEHTMLCDSWLWWGSPLLAPFCVLFLVDWTVDLLPKYFFLFLYREFFLTFFAFSCRIPRNFLKYFFFEEIFL